MGCEFRLTANQNLVIARVVPADKPEIESIFASYEVANPSNFPLRLNSIACTALPTCSLALAESERYLQQI